MRDLLNGSDWPAGEPLDEARMAAMYAEMDRPAPRRRPWLALDMVSSVDGAVTVDGRSGPLSSPGDKAVFRALRGLADVVLVGAGTVRAENYGPPRLAEDLVAARTARGQVPLPRMAVVTASLDLDPELGMFTGDTAPLIITCGGRNHPTYEALAERAEIRHVGEGRVDLAAAMAGLAEDGTQVVVCEGGPHLNAELLAEGLVDELCATVAPLLVGGHAGRIVGAGRDIGEGVAMDLDRLIEHEGSLFCRWLVRR